MPMWFASRKPSRGCYIARCNTVPVLSESFSVSNFNNDSSFKLPSVAL